LGGVTQSPRPGVYCKQNISDFSVCGQDQKEITIDENFCLSVDYLGRPVDIYSQFKVQIVSKNIVFIATALIGFGRDFFY